MAQRSYDSWITDPVNAEFHRICDDNETEKFVDGSDAVFALIEELYEGSNFDSLRASQALQFLAKLHKVPCKEIDFDYPNVVSQITLAKVRMHEEEKIRDIKKAVNRHTQILKYEIYGDEEVDIKTVDQAITNLAWIVDQPTKSDRKVKIRRV